MALKSRGTVMHRELFLLVHDRLYCTLCPAGFEGCSMVPSIYPLETLHNSLSLKQVDEFLNSVCESNSEVQAKTMKGAKASV